MGEIKEPNLETVLKMTELYSTYDMVVSEAIQNKIYTKEQWSHYYYVNLALNASMDSYCKEEAERLVPFACQAAARVFRISVEEAKRDYNIVLDHGHPKAVIVEPDFDGFVKTIDRYISGDTDVIEGIENKLYSKKQFAHYYYVNLALNKSVPKKARDDPSLLEAWVELACKSAAKVFKISVEDAKRDYELVYSNRWKSWQNE